MGQGVNYNQGLRAAVVHGLTLRGYTPIMLGDDTGNTGNEKYLYNTMGNTLSHQSKGGITLRQLIDGSSPLGPLVTALSQKPEIGFMHCGTNGVTADDANRFFQLWAGMKNNAPLFWVTPLDSISTAVDYYNIDTARAASTEIIRTAAKTAGVKCCIINGPQAIGRWAWYPINGATISAPDSTDTAADTVTWTVDPGLISGQEVKPLSTVGGLTADTTYWVNRASSGTYSFHTSRANAIAGASKVNLTASITSRIAPNHMTAGDNNANGLFVDSTHVTPEANLLTYAAIHAQLFGMSIDAAVKELTSSGPFAPVPWMQGQATTTGTQTVFNGQNASRKKVITSINARADAGAALTGLVVAVRKSQDGSTTSRTRTLWAFDLLASTRYGHTWEAKSLASECSGPVAHYNEEVQVILTGGGGYVTLGLQQLVA